MSVITSSDLSSLDEILSQVKEKLHIEPNVLMDSTDSDPFGGITEMPEEGHAMVTHSELKKALDSLSQSLLNKKKLDKPLFTVADFPTTPEPTTEAQTLLAKIGQKILREVKKKIGSNVVGSVIKIGDKTSKLVMQFAGTEHVSDSLKLSLIMKIHDNETVSFANVPDSPCKVGLYQNISPDALVLNIIEALEYPLQQVISVPKISVTVTDKNGNQIVLESMDEIDRVLDEIEAARDAWLLKEEADKAA